MENENKCGLCNGSKCCTYVTEPVGEAPRSRADFDYLLWQVSHQGIEVYKDEDGWYLLFQAECEHLQPDGGCGIYQDRPQICRDHSNDWCEHDEPAEKNFELYFRNHAELLAYCRKRFKRWDR